jgi:hypothetical protein
MSFQADLCETLGLNPTDHRLRYQYSVRDKSACLPHCMPLSGMVFNGQELKEKFPHATQITTLVWRANNTHPNCRCKLTCINAPEICVEFVTKALQKRAQ